MTYMRLENIKIKDSFSTTLPKEEKVAVCKAYWEIHKKQDRYIIVDHNNVLIDGYIQYLVLKEVGIEIVEVKISDKKRKKWSRKRMLPKQSKPKKLTYRESNTTYVFGTLLYSRSKKERVWRIPSNWKDDRIADFNIGDVVMVHNQNGLSPIKITRIEKLNNCPVDIPVKKVVGKYY
ncbi:hypothetical protein C823_007824 [Eubacterium plexicaudatum ASF492]|uniref:Uncharacterized protein n=1 Tax=Eubacterium plexicaudatum ASF492 TaxID=1235802 RepID=N1ZVV5_9FIRM|nr:hypothetical protein C823_007824 [Eubacterium plexicaudatum ASF492]